MTHSEWEHGKNLTIADSQAKKDWIKQNTTFIGLKLNNRTDADILQALEGKQRQTELKRLIRQGLAQEEK